MPLARLLLIALTLLALPASAADRKPNILLILCDDLGYGDLACYGNSKIKTPNIDRLAKEGIRFTQFYAAGVQCTPSRAGLLTGRYPVRFGLTHAFMENTGGIPASETLLPAAVQKQGYRTALVGKWHLGDRAEDHPLRHGFDRFDGLLRGHDVGAREVWQNEKIIEKNAAIEGLTDRWTTSAERIIAEESKRIEPWFVMVSHTSPHVPLGTAARFKGQSTGGAYGDAVEEIDDSVGRLMRAIALAGAADHTVVFFTSDNGPSVDQGEKGGSTGGLRGGKYSVYEGGISIPMIVWANNRWKPREVTKPAILLDLMPTCVGLAGGKSAKNLDGVDLGGLLNGQPALEPRELLFYFRDEPRACRSGDWKWVTEEGRDHLYNIHQDVREEKDISAEHKEVVVRLKTRALTLTKAMKPE